MGSGAKRVGQGAEVNGLGWGSGGFRRGNGVFGLGKRRDRAWKRRGSARGLCGRAQCSLVYGRLMMSMRCFTLCEAEGMAGGQTGRPTRQTISR